jgi:PHD/YefM family antitoxin component YafN of YafNO toxin-antitoxin module
MPITVAARKGVSAVATAATDTRVVLTNHGRPVAIVDSAERIDADLRRLREAAAAVLDAAADLVSQRSSTFDLDEVCVRLGIDPERVRARAGQRCADDQ